MENAISVILVLAALLSVVSVPVGLFNLRIFQAAQGAKCTGMSFVKAFVPLSNIIYARRIAYGRSPVFFWLLIACGVLLLFRIVSLFLVVMFPILIVYSAISTYILLLLYLALYIVNAVDFARMFSCGTVTVLCCAVIAPVGYYMLAAQVLAAYGEVEDEVSERFGSSS